MYTHLAISGGGIKGSAIIGALSILYENKLLENLEAFIGSSVGGLICFLLNIGYTHQELKEILLNIDFSQYRELQFSSIIDKWGFDNGDKLIRLLIATIKQKDIEPTITFKELYEKTNQLLVITGSELISNQAIYYNHETYPEMKVLDAIRITISFPLVFSPFINSEQILIDGAMFSPYPIDYFKNVKNKIGIVLHNPHNQNEITSCEDYLITLFKCMSERYEKLFLKDYHDDSIIIEINNIHGMDFSLSKDDKYEMFKLGYDAAQKYINEKSLVGDES
jgi:predicted acylesterase/phospholipase RssA